MPHLRGTSWKHPNVDGLRPILSADSSLLGRPFIDSSSRRAARCAASPGRGPACARTLLRGPIVTLAGPTRGSDVLTIGRCTWMLMPARAFAPSRRRRMSCMAHRRATRSAFGRADFACLTHTPQIVKSGMAPKRRSPAQLAAASRGTASKKQRACRVVHGDHTDSSGG